MPAVRLEFKLGSSLAELPQAFTPVMSGFWWIVCVEHAHFDDAFDVCAIAYFYAPR